ncbi:LytR/AlgR family response regulator transcription factor [Flavobacterium facile]|uniref:LytR/AlgR family response regulator transcription factor n=1 Tax=Flavobacterium facile TaxID=2893174 RepID=UPI002E76417D|nr:response regulator transcription factor [Flavobacterium sp. T-12]
MLCEEIEALEIVKVFNNPEKLLEEIPLIPFDLCITDIEMPGMDGLTLASQLQNKLVIFTTAYKDYASEAFDIDVVDYITKPVTKERLQKAVLKAIDKHKSHLQNNAFITLNTDKGKGIVYINQLAYIKAAEQDSRDKEAFLSDGSVVLLKNINFVTLLHQLPENVFCRVNKKEIIAISQVKHYTHNEITLSLQDKTDAFIRVALSETYSGGFLRLVGV